MQVYEDRHVVCFEETNVAGNVYYVNHLRWQGRCRELFLRQYAPALVEQIGRDFTIVTVRCSCEYLMELFALDEVVVRMRLGALTQGRLSMRFEYWRVSYGSNQLVARGEQEVACMARVAGRMAPAPWPAFFAEAVERFAGAQEAQA